MEKLHSNITQCLKLVMEDCKRYSTAVDEGLNHVELLVAHLTTHRKVEDSNIEDTDFYKLDPDAKRKLQFCIMKEILLEKIPIQKNLNDLEIIHDSVIKQCVRIFNMCRSGVLHDISLTDITVTDEMLCSIAEKIDAVDTFKVIFANDHLSRKFTIDYCILDGDLERIIGCWKSSVISVALEELALIL